MPESLQRLRRSATQLAIRQVIAATSALPIGAQRSTMRSVAALAGGVPLLRRRVRENMRLALGDGVPEHAERRYFDHLGWLYAHSLATFNHGLVGACVPQEVKFDQSIRLLDEAMAEGHGVVFCPPHWVGHELTSATVALRHPMVMLVRDAPTAERTARKLKWYNALGAEIVLRPSSASTIKDAVAYLKVLKRGKILAMTPDLLADAEQGVEVTVFGRPARLFGGAFALALSAGAPIIRFWCQWQPDATPMLTFDRVTLRNEGDRDAAVRIAAQDWCRWFEEKLRANPENWLFWLDKRWSRFLRATPRISGHACRS